MKKSVLIDQYMLSNPVRVTPDMSVEETAHEILINKISGVCVVDAENNLLGVVSELDCLKAILNSAYNDNDAFGARVEDIMTTEVDTNKRNDDIISVASQMLEKRQRRRPIVEDGKLIGQISCRQIIKATKDFLNPEDPMESLADAED